jgi:hypothetical protein
MPISMLGPKLSCPGRVAPHPKLWTPKIGAKWEPAMSDDAGFQRLLNAFGLTPKADALPPKDRCPSVLQKVQQDGGPTAKDWKEYGHALGKRDILSLGRHGEQGKPALGGEP